jgi:hypothetical protein
MSERSEQICALNDQVRQTMSTGLVVITPGGRGSWTKICRADRQDCLRLRRLLSCQRPS